LTVIASEQDDASTSPGRPRHIGIVTFRDVIAPIPAGVRSPHVGRKPSTSTTVEQDYEQIRIKMQTLVNDLAISTPAAAETTICRSCFARP